MADDTIDQRLAAIEAALPTLATRDHLEKIEKEIHDLTELITRALAENEKRRDETQLLHGMAGGMAAAGMALVAYVERLNERVSRLENRTP